MTHRSATPGIATTALGDYPTGVNDALNPQAKQMAHESMVRNLAAQAEAIWPQESVLLTRYPLPASLRILDAGCGTGEASVRLAELFSGANRAWGRCPGHSPRAGPRAGRTARPARAVREPVDLRPPGPLGLVRRVASADHLRGGARELTRSRCRLAQRCERPRGRLCARAKACPFPLRRVKGSPTADSCDSCTRGTF